MAQSVLTLIQEEFEQRLQGCGEAVEVVMPDLLDNFSPRHKQLILVPGDPERAPEYDCQGNPPATAWKVSFMVRSVLFQDDDEPGQEPLDFQLAEFMASAYQTIVEVANWHQFGGNAINAMPGNIARAIADDGSLAAYEVTFDVWFRTDETNPFTRR